MKVATSPLLVIFAFWLRGQWVVAPAAALDGNVSKKSLDAYGGWCSFKVVTQGDEFREYPIPGQFDGIGVSCFVLGHTVPYHSNHLVSSYVCHNNILCDFFYTSICHQ
jgi:hypothetical protein